MKYSHVIIGVAIILGMLGCKVKQKNGTLLFSPDESFIDDKKMILDSIVIRKTERTILIRQYRGAGDYLEIKSVKINNGFAELRKKFYGNIENETDAINANLMPVDTLPIFNMSDTIFTYKSNRKYYFTTIDLSLGDALYRIEKNENTYVSSRQSAIDNSYEEEYYYDMNFNIIKYVVKYRGNTCVYR